MKPRAVLSTIILASALALGISCKTPLVEGPASLKTRQYHAPKAHPCARHVIKGGIPNSCHILFQIHRCPLVQEIPRDAVHSQILLYRVISDLIKNHGVGVVFLEGADISEDLRKDLRSKCDKKCSDKIQGSIGRCASDVAYTDLMGGRFFDSPAVSRRIAEEFCLAKVLLHSYSLANISKVLLILNNPSVLFTGFERNKRKRFQVLKKHRILWKLRKVIGPLLNPQAEIAFEKFLFSSIEELKKPRLKYVDKDAVREAIFHTSQNTVLVIGLGHKERIEKAILAIPFDERPTFYFVMPECPGIPTYSISSRAIKLASEASSRNR
jgi:hypothetical protein